LSYIRQKAMKKKEFSLSRIIKIWFVATFILVIAVSLFYQHNLFQTEAMLFYLLLSFVLLLIFLLIWYLTKQNSKTQ
jgi:amino acid permease